MTRIVMHVAVSDTFYNTENGVVARIPVPGHGVVFFDEDYTALCELLG